MTALLCAIALTVTPAQAECRGGHAVSPPQRGGHSVLVVLERVRHYREWLCIHSHEGAWNDPGDPYHGGLQFDRSFMRAYGRDMLRKYHGRWAEVWSPRDQMLVAERAWRVRGFTPWPATARMCGLL
jgi:hypothetical protein